jgi:hypothetical protein
MNTRIIGALVVLMLGIGTVAAAAIGSEGEEGTRENEQANRKNWRKVFLAGRAVGPGIAPTDPAEVEEDARPAHIHRVRIGAKVHKNGKIAKGTCSVDGVRYRLDARKDDEGVWQAKLKNEDDHGEATLRWVEENGRFEGTLTLEEHQHRLFMRRVRPLQAEPEPLDE